MIGRAALCTAALLVLAAPELASACAVCTGNQEEASTAAFRYTTALLSVLPLAMIGGAVLWFRRRMREIDAEAATRALPPPEPVLARRAAARR